MEIDHYVWKSPYETLQKWFQYKLQKFGGYKWGELSSWKNIIAILKLRKENSHHL